MCMYIHRCPCLTSSAGIGWTRTNAARQFAHDSGSPQGKGSFFHPKRKPSILFNQQNSDDFTNSLASCPEFIVVVYRHYKLPGSTT